jgi:hypothetical protein
MTKDKLIIEKQKELIKIQSKIIKVLISTDYSKIQSLYDKQRIIQSELTALPSEITETKSDFFLMVHDGNSTRLFKNGEKISPTEFIPLYGCKLTEEQKKSFEEIQKQYFNALEYKQLKSQKATPQVSDEKNNL